MDKETTSLLPIALALIIVGSANTAQGACWEEAAHAYNIPVAVLKAVAQTESHSRPGATHRNADGSQDIGLMQINSTWLPSLAQYGIQEKELKDACTNLKVGAWILARNAIRLGWNWNAIGAYNVGCARLERRECERRRSTYAWKIHQALKAVPETAAAPPAVQLASSDALAKSIRIVRLAVAPTHSSANDAVQGEAARQEDERGGDDD